MIKLAKLTEKSNKKFGDLCEKGKIDLNINDFETEEISPPIEIDDSKEFKNKFELGQYLYEKLNNIEVSNDIWHFLIITYHKQLIKNNKIGEIDRFFIDDTKPFYPFTHLLKPVLDLYFFYFKDPQLIKFLLLNPVNESSGLFLEVIKRQEIMKNDKFIEVSKKIFYDETKKRNREGSGDGIRRLITLFNQYGRTYDLYSMPSEKFLKDLLIKHKEFDKFKTKGLLKKSF